MNKEEILKNLDELQEYVCNAITDCKAVIREHDNIEQVENGIYRLSDTAKDIIYMAGFITAQLPTFK